MMPWVVLSFLALLVYQGGDIVDAFSLGPPVGASSSRIHGPVVPCPPSSSSSSHASWAVQQQSSSSSSLFSSTSTTTTTTTTTGGTIGVGVDMNQYNLNSLEDRAAEWTAAIIPATPLQEEGIYLQARNSREIMVDTVRVHFARSPAGGGLGLQLLELAGGREDGLGIVIVEEIVEGGAADGSGLLPGDSIVKVELQRSKTTTDDDGDNGNSPLEVTETMESFCVETECFGYDKTVEALQLLPPPPVRSDDDSAAINETFVVTVKRLRRKPKVQVTLQYPPAMKEPDVSLELFAGENFRRALLVRGTKLNDPLAKRFDSGGSGDCGAEGTCATCAVSVTRGMDLLSPPGRVESQIFRQTPRWRMSCKAVVGYGMREGQITVRVNPKQWGEAL